MFCINREWKDGLFASLLRKFCVQPPNQSYSYKVKPVMKIMQLDGEVITFVCLFFPDIRYMMFLKCTLGYTKADLIVRFNFLCILHDMPV